MKDIKIKNKIESIKIIEELNLNKFPEKLFKQQEENLVIEFINKYKVKYYAIRDKSKPNGEFKLKVDYKDVLNEIKEYEIYTINVSSINYSNNQKLVGEIQVLTNNEVYITVTTNPKASVRDALNNPTFNLKTNIFDNKLDKIPYFNMIYSYIIDHDLKDLIVEFAVFNTKIGINNENVIIYELRTDY